LLYNNFNIMYIIHILKIMTTTELAAVNLGAIKDLIAESTVMKRFDHPNVLPLLGVCVDPDDGDDGVFKVILPFMANGDLRSFLKLNRVEPTNTDQFSDVSGFYGIKMLFIQYFIEH